MARISDDGKRLGGCQQPKLIWFFLNLPSQRLIGVLDIPELKLHCNFRGWQNGVLTLGEMGLLIVES
jgi:hypothetical protein